MKTVNGTPMAVKDEKSDKSEKLEKMKALQATMDKLEKSFGKGIVMKLSDQAIVDIPVIPTGSLGQDF